MILNFGAFWRRYATRREYSKFPGNPSSAELDGILVIRCGEVEQDGRVKVNVVSSDPNGRYAKNVDELFANAHIISIHVPLLPETRNLINQENPGKMKDGVLIANTSRGEIINTHDLVEAIKSVKVRGCLRGREGVHLQE